MRNDAQPVKDGDSRLRLLGERPATSRAVSRQQASLAEGLAEAAEILSVVHSVFAV